MEWDILKDYYFPLVTVRQQSDSYEGRGEKLITVNNNPAIVSESLVISLFGLAYYR